MSAARRHRRGGEPAWARADDDTLLALRFRDLGVRIEGSALEERVARLREELFARGLGFTLPAWLSTDWFSADDVPGIAIPFYLAHPRLARLERSIRFAVEGGRARECRMLLRHEAGHAIDTAFELSRRREWREAFGNRSEPYRTSYRANPWSRDYVHHLPQWYAQSHPADDFAETFAVWLAPRSGWRSRYAGTRAERKLQLVDALMGEIRGRPPRVRSRERPYSLSGLTETLGSHYARHRPQLAIGPGHPFDRDLLAVFPPGRPGARTLSAARHLRHRARAIVTRIAGELDVPPYSVQQVVDDMILRARELNLRLHRASRPPTLTAIRHAIARALRRLRRGGQSLYR